MTTATWMLYGATGYTGILIAERAVAQGLRPILAGRSEARLRPLAERLGLDYRVIALDDPPALEQALADVALVLHAAGPFTFTSAPMRKACLKTQTHYLDISGEISIFEETFKHDALAQQANILLVSGVGYDVVPTDCLVLHLHQQLPTATHLTIALTAGKGGSMGASAGTLKSSLEIMKRGFVARRNGEYVAIGVHTKTVEFQGYTLTALAVPWGDLAVAYRTTGIPNITTLLTLHKKMIRLLRWTWWLLPVLLAIKPLRRLMQWGIDRLYKDKATTLTGKEHTQIWAELKDAAGASKQGWLITPEAYVFTAISAVDAVEQALNDPRRGALTPAQLMGADYIFGVEGVTYHGD